MSKENKSINSIIKSKFFLKLFGVPSICYIILSLIVIILPTEPGDEPITFIDIITDVFIPLIIWFVISFVIALIIDKFKKKSIDTGTNIDESKNDSIVKSKFFLKLFGIPTAFLIILMLMEIIIPVEPGDDYITLFELISGNCVLIIVWFAISYVISLIRNEIKKIKPKTHTTKEVQYMAKNDEKIVANPEESNEDMKEKDKKKTKKNDKCLYTCDSTINSYEYKKMVKYFPQMYWAFVFQRTILNLIITSIVAISFESLAVTLVFLVAFQIFIMIVCKVRLEYFAEKNYEQFLKKGIACAEIHTEFYDDHFIREGDTLILKIQYGDIDRCVETDTNFYLEYKKRNTIIIIQKNTCDLKLISFIRKKFENIENNLGEEPKFKNSKKNSNSDFIKIFMIVLLIITIGSLWGVLWSYTLVINITHQHFDLFKSAWVGFCWLPIPLLSIILGFKYKKVGNIVVGFIVGFYLSLFGIGSLIGPTISQDYNQIYDYKDIIDARLPSNGELTIEDWETYFEDDKTDYKIIIAYYDNEDVSDLVNSIQNSSNWFLSKELKSKFKIMIPRTFSSDDDVYYSIYNKTTNEYNTLPQEEGIYEIYTMKYDESSKLLQIHKYNYSYK